ncbi:MAG: formylglycine-generating enzyme family protein [Spirochaetales bacterium]|nr:formylglycine-generating enzyme family protein [Spirochaetales bacterium]
MIQKTNLIFIIPFLFLFSCCLDSEKDLLKDFVFVKGATIEGAIQAEGYIQSPGFVAGETVTIADFYMCEHEVTQKEFARYYEGYEYRINENEKGIGPNYPAYDVNWFDTLVYCNNRSIAEGRTPCYTISGSTNPKDWGKIPKSRTWESWDDWVNVECDFSANGYRLPTHKEWEYAARGGNGLEGYQFQYAGSDNLDEVAVWNTDVVSEIKTKKPNGLGIYDLNGNIEEWTFDRYKGKENILYAGGYYFYKQPDAFALSRSYAGCMAITLAARNSQIGLRVVCTAD